MQFSIFEFKIKFIFSVMLSLNLRNTTQQCTGYGNALISTEVDLFRILNIDKQ